MSETSRLVISLIRLIDLYLQWSSFHIVKPNNLVQQLVSVFEKSTLIKVWYVHEIILVGSHLNSSTDHLTVQIKQMYLVTKSFSCGTSPCFWHSPMFIHYVKNFAIHITLKNKFLRSIYCSWKIKLSVNFSNNYCSARLPLLSRTAWFTDWTTVGCVECATSLDSSTNPSIRYINNFLYFPKFPMTSCQIIFQQHDVSYWYLSNTMSFVSNAWLLS